MKITIQTDEGPQELDANVRPSGLAIHQIDLEARTIHTSHYGETTQHRHKVQYLRYAITHLASGLSLVKAPGPVSADHMAGILERSGVDWHAAEEEIMSSEDARGAVEAARAWREGERKPFIRDNVSHDPVISASVRGK